MPADVLEFITAIVNTACPALRGSEPGSEVLEILKTLGYSRLIKRERSRLSTQSIKSAPSTLPSMYAAK